MPFFVIRKSVSGEKQSSAGHISYYRLHVFMTETGLLPG